MIRTRSRIRLPKSRADKRRATWVSMSRRKIVRFETDDEGHWRAELECGHFQHVRHRPPLEAREWVLDAAERDRRIGVELKCAKCDEKKIERIED